MDNEKLVFVDADLSIENFSIEEIKDISGNYKDPWETDEF